MPSSLIRSSLFGIVMLWATDFLPLWKNVSGVQILLAIRLLRRSTAIGPLNFSLSSFQLCLKNTSMVYSYRQNIKRWTKPMNKGLSFLSYLEFSIFTHSWFTEHAVLCMFKLSVCSHHPHPLFFLFIYLFFIFSYDVLTFSWWF